MSLRAPKLLVQGATIDEDARSRSPDLEKVHFLQSEYRSRSPSPDLPHPPAREEYYTFKKGDIELIQLGTSDTPTAGLLDTHRPKRVSSATLQAPVTNLSAPSSFSPPHKRTGGRTERSAAKTIRQAGKVLEHSDQIDIDSDMIVKDLMALSKNSPSGANCLHYAQSRKEFCSQVSQNILTELGIDINSTDNDGDTPLHWAVNHSHLENIEFLLSKGANDTICNKSEEAPIHLAIKSGRTDSAKILFSLKRESQILFSFRGRNYLHLACEENNKEMVQLILSCSPKGRLGSDALDLTVPLVSLVDDDNLSPLHTAAKKCSPWILERLLYQLEEARQKESMLLTESKEGFTPLHYAVDAGRLGNVQLLLRHGASPLTSSRQQQVSSLHLAAIRWTENSPNAVLNELIKWAKGYDPSVVDIRDAQDKSPLHYAATYDHVQSATILQNYGANLDVIDRDGNTPLVVSASKGANKVLKLLLSQGADPTSQNNKGQTALVVAIEEGHWKTARALMNCGKEETQSVLVRIPDDIGQTPLHVICKGQGDFKTMQLLLVLQADMHMHDRNRRIPLHYACHHGSYSMGYQLLQEGVWGSMLNDVDYKGHTSLHMSAKKGHYDLVRLLLQKGAHITKSLSHDSPFALACQFGHIKCAQLIYKANNTIKDWQNGSGETALHLSATNGHKETVLWLLNIGCVLLWNYSCKSFIDIAIEKREQTLVSAVLDHSRWHEVMKFCSPGSPPPFVSLIKHLPDLSKIILERAIQKSPLPIDHDDYFERVEFGFLIGSSCSEDTFQRASSLISRPYRSVNKSAHARHYSDQKSLLKLSTFSKEEQTHVGKGSELKEPKPTKPSLWSRVKSHYTLRNLLRSRYEYEESSLYALHTMIDNYRISLLTHPVTKRYLDYKWRTYGRMYYSISNSPFFLFMLLLIAEVFFTFYFSKIRFEDAGMVGRSNGSCSSFFQYNETFLNLLGYVNATLATTNFLEFSKLAPNFMVINRTDVNNYRCECHPIQVVDLWRDREFLIIIPLYLTTALLLIIQLYKIIKQPILYWFSILNLMEISTLLVTLSMREEISVNLDRAALALFLGCGALFLYLRRYSWSGIYVTMFIEVITSMVKTILVFLPILFAYTIIFFLIISPARGFEDLFVSVVRIPIMLVGELDFYDSFLVESECYRNKEMVYFLVILFTFAITISLANLLIGLAVGDIDNILRQAVVTKAIEQVNWLTEFELGNIYPFFKKWIETQHVTVFPNKKRHLFTKVIAPIDVFGFWSQLNTTHDKINSDISDPNLLFLINLKEENSSLKMQLQHASDKISGVENSLAQIFQMVQKLDRKLDFTSNQSEDGTKTLTRSPLQLRRRTDPPQ